MATTVPQVNTQSFPTVTHQGYQVSPQTGVPSPAQKKSNKGAIATGALAGGLAGSLLGPLGVLGGATIGGLSANAISKEKNKSSKKM